MGKYQSTEVLVVSISLHPYHTVAVTHFRKFLLIPKKEVLRQQRFFKH